ncbi:Global transcription regulator sge1 [Rhizina undulata]
MSDYIPPNRGLMNSSPKPHGGLDPTYHGFLLTTRDALLLIQAVENGIIEGVPRRPHDKERERLIRSGNIFVFTEQGSGVRRWTDGFTWSPSRIMGNFLLYREMAEPFSPGEKKRARRKRSDGSFEYTSPDPPQQQQPPPTPLPECDRYLVGSLWDSYGFKTGGLVKKTLSIMLHGRKYHVVAYYSIEHAKRLTGTPQLMEPSKDPNLNTLALDSDFLNEKLRDRIDANGIEIPGSRHSNSPGPSSEPPQDLPQGPQESNHQPQDTLDFNQMFGDPAMFSQSGSQYAGHYESDTSTSNITYDTVPSTAFGFHFEPGPGIANNVFYTGQNQSTSSNASYATGLSTSPNSLFYSQPSQPNSSGSNYAAGPSTALHTHYASGPSTTPHVNYVAAGPSTTSNANYQAPRNSPRGDLVETTNDSSYYQHQHQQPGNGFGSMSPYGNSQPRTVIPSFSSTGLVRYARTGACGPPDHHDSNAYHLPPFQTQGIQNMNYQGGLAQSSGLPAWNPVAESSNQSTPMSRKRKSDQN